jgi:hypothetical protein
VSREEFATLRQIFLLLELSEHFRELTSLSPVGLNLAVKVVARSLKYSLTFIVFANHSLGSLPQAPIEIFQALSECGDFVAALTTGSSEEEISP